MNIELIKSTENSVPNPGALLSVVNPEVPTLLYIQIREHFFKVEFSPEFILYTHVCPLKGSYPRVLRSVG